jgi:hypothetical protein
MSVIVTEVVQDVLLVAEAESTLLVTPQPAPEINVTEALNSITVTTEETASVVIQPGEEVVVLVQDVGMQGPPGPPGIPGGTRYTHVQIEASALWLIQHDLGYKPQVTVVDSADTKVYGDIHYLNDNQLEIGFTAPFSGKAYVA